MCASFFCGHFFNAFVYMARRRYFSSIWNFWELTDCFPKRLHQFIFCTYGSRAYIRVLISLICDYILFEVLFHCNIYLHISEEKWGWTSFLHGHRPFFMSSEETCLFRSFSTFNRDWSFYYGVIKVHYILDANPSQLYDLQIFSFTLLFDFSISWLCSFKHTSF